MTDIVHMRAKNRALVGPFREVPTMLCGDSSFRAEHTAIKREVTCRRCKFKLLSRPRRASSKAETPRRAKPLPPVNRKRKAKRDALTFGEQAHLCRYMPCPVHFAAYWRGHGIATVVADARVRRTTYGKAGRISDPHHTKTVGAGGRDEHTAPLCRDCHIEIDAPNSGVSTFQQRHGVDLRAVAAAIHEALSKERAA